MVKLILKGFVPWEAAGAGRETWKRGERKGQREEGEERTVEEGEARIQGKMK